jgi:hypothetical protein
MFSSFPSSKHSMASNLIFLKLFNNNAPFVRPSGVLLTNSNYSTVIDQLTELGSLTSLNEYKLMIMNTCCPINEIAQRLYILLLKRKQGAEQFLVNLTLIQLSTSTLPKLSEYTEAVNSKASFKISRTATAIK